MKFMQRSSEATLRKTLEEEQRKSELESQWVLDHLDSESLFILPKRFEVHI